MVSLHAKPYVPGRARGIVNRDSDAVSSNSILILKQQARNELTSLPAGILVIDGAPFSHFMIHLLTLGIPTVLISKEVADKLTDGDEVLIDGFNGTLISQPEHRQETTVDPETPEAGKAISLNNGIQILLRASIFHTEDAELAVNKGAADIGLARTEFLLPEAGQLPDEAFYETALHNLCKIARPLSVTLRLPDIAPGKQIPFINMPPYNSAPLGMQGVRLYREEPVKGMVMSLLDAVNNLAGEYEINLMVPYVTNINEFSHWRGIIEQRLDKPVPIGAMVESPVAVLAIPQWFDVADFIAIGCNDLMQCLFAADRDLPGVSSYLDYHSPELFNFLQQAAEAAGENINKVQLCGLLPQIAGVLPVLLGMGYRVFSIAPVMIPYLAKVARETDMTQAKDLSQHVCQAKDIAQVPRILLNN